MRESLSSGFSSYPLAESSSSSEYRTMDGAGRGGALEPIMAKLEEAEAADMRVPLELLWNGVGFVQLQHLQLISSFNLVDSTDLMVF